MDHLGLLQTIYGPDQGIVIGVAHAAHRGLDPSFTDARYSGPKKESCRH